MLALCFPVLMSLALAAPGVSRNCNNYCKSHKPELMNGDPPLECNCADLIATSIEAKELSTVTLDDTGVYFVPAELQLFQEQFASQPFVILNPAKLVPKSGISIINREFDAKRDSLVDLMPSQSAHVEIHERTETISHTSINQEWGRETPLYLDLELEDTNGNERAAVHKSTLVEDVESTEEALVECLDYQVIHYTRKYGFIKEFKEFWKARNLNRYEQVPNKEIEEKIKEHCSKPEAIVQHSLHEIKQALPKKGPESESVVKNKKEHWEVNNTTRIDKTLLADITDYRNSTSLITLSSPSNNATGTDQTETYNTSTENYIVSNNATKLYDTTFDPTANWPFITFINSSHSSILDKEPKNEIDQNPTPSVVTDSPQTATTTENISIVVVQEKPTIPANRKKAVTESELELDSNPTDNWPFKTFIDSSHSSILDKETKNEIDQNPTPSVVTDSPQTATTTENISIVDIQEKPTIPANRKKTVTERESELDSDPTENWPFKTFTNSSHSSISNKETKNEIDQNPTPSVVTDSPQTATTTENISIVDIQEKPTIPANRKKTVTERESELDADPTENGPIKTFIDSSHSSILDKETKNEIDQNSTPSVVTDSAQTATTTENISIKKEKPTIPANRKKAVTESELDSDMASMASEDVFHTYRNIKLTQGQTGRPILDKITNSLSISNTPSSTEESLGKVTATEEVSIEKSLAQEYVTTEVNIEQSFGIENATPKLSTKNSLGKKYATPKSTEESLGKKYATTKVSKEESLGKEYATTEVIFSDMESSINNDTTQIVVNSGYSHIRNTYDEKEIKIPKITTKECRNTVYSAIIGTEELPNDDFIDSTTAESGYSETRIHNGNNENDITGKLYFLSKTELVPVRFVQSNTGAISLGIDGIALCDKLVRKTNKNSRLLASLCDYMENV